MASFSIEAFAFKLIFTLSLYSGSFSTEALIVSFTFGFSFSSTIIAFFSTFSITVFFLFNGAFSITSSGRLFSFLNFFSYASTSASIFLF
jgi:hypothetical protein